jgi:hypothetical protein
LVLGFKKSHKVLEFRHDKKRSCFAWRQDLGAQEKFVRNQWQAWGQTREAGRQCCGARSFSDSAFILRCLYSTQFEPVFSTGTNDNFRDKFGLTDNLHLGKESRIAPRHCRARQHAPAQIRIGGKWQAHPNSP